MSGWSVVRWTGALGLASIVLQVLTYIVFTATAPPTAGFAIDDANKMLAYVKNWHFGYTTGLLLGFIGLALFIGFIAGLRAIAVTAAADREWLATTMFGAGIALTVITFVAGGLGISANAIAASHHPDAAQVRMLFEAVGMVGGPPWLVAAALFLGAAGSLGSITGILPRWLALVGWIGSVLTLIAAFSAYGGSDPTAFWSPDGTVTTLAVLPFWVWTLGASIVFLRQKGATARLHK
jgi:hypothetical protein